jgi:outer membrane protein assembly complex protein YaeT
LKTQFLYILFSLLTCFSFAQDNIEIKRIKIKGQSAVSKSKIKERMTLETTSWFKRKILKKDVVLFTQDLYKDDIKGLKQLYQKEGYLDIIFDSPAITFNKKQKIKLSIFINEGSPTKVIEVSYLVDSTKTIQQALPKKESRNILLQSQLISSKIFSDETFYHDQLIIAEGFGNIGYPKALINYDLKVDTLSNTANLKWLINKGPLVYFGPTNVSGNERIPDKSILRQLAYNEGDIWSLKKIEQTQKQIYMQGMYRVASVNAQVIGQISDTIPVTIQIKEAPRWSTRFGAGYGSEDDFRVFADLEYLGFITKTGRLKLYGKHSGLEPYNFYLRFFQPSVFLPFNTMVLNPYFLHEDEPGYKLKKTGVSVSMLQNLSKQVNTSIGYTFEDVNLDTTYNASGEGNINSDSIYDKAGIILGGIYSTANPILDPVQGYSVSLNFKTNKVLIGGEMPFFKILTEYKSYFGLRNGIILALKAKIGGAQRTDVDELIPVDERFFSGGSNSVRGWPRSELGPKDESGRPIGGNSLLEGTVEFRFDLSYRFSMNLFCDAGNVWEDSFSYHFNDLHYSAGAGIHIKTPIGPAGIEFARPIFEEDREWQILFNIGYSF